MRLGDAGDYSTKTLNRTILELKSETFSAKNIKDTPLNRTILELKYPNTQDYEDSFEALNRTILELKCKIIIQITKM